MSADEDITVDRSAGNRFGNVDARIIEDRTYTRNARLAYAALACRAGAGRAGRVKRKTLAEDLGMSLDTLDRAVAEMVAAGIAEIIPRFGANGSRVANGYRLHDFFDLPEEAVDRARVRHEERSGGGTSPDPGRTDAAGGGRTDAAGVAAPVRLGGPHPRGGGSRTGAAPKRTEEGFTTEGLTTNPPLASLAADAGSDGALFDVDPPPPSPPSGPPQPRPETEAQTEAQRINTLTAGYVEAVPLSSYPAVRGIVRRAVTARRGGEPLYADEEIADALTQLATEGRSVTMGTLRVALEGLPPLPARGRVTAMDERASVTADLLARTRARESAPPVTFRNANTIEGTTL